MGRFKMENDRLVVTIDDLGAELVSIYDKKYSRELRHRSFVRMEARITAAITCIRADIMCRISMVLPEIMCWKELKKVRLL